MNKQVQDLQRWRVMQVEYELSVSRQ